MTRATRAKHDELGIEIEQYRHAEKSPELAALGFVLPEQWKGEIDDLSEIQELPQRGGMTMGQLFKHDQLVLSKHDRHAIAAAAAAGPAAGRQGRQSNIDNKMMAVTAADASLNEAVFALKATISQHAAGLNAQVAAVHDIAAFDAAQAAQEARGEIEQIQQVAGRFKSAIGIITSVSSSAMFFKGIGGDASAGDGVGQAGSFASAIVDLIAEDRMSAAKQRLALAEADYTSQTGKALHAKLQAAQHTVLAMISSIEAHRSGLYQALTLRRQAYNALGFAASTHTPCPEQSRRRISAILAAIPLAEYVAGRARAITLISTPPPYTGEAGRGYAMAVKRKEVKLPVFLRAWGEIRHIGMFYSADAAKWETRLSQLNAVKTQIGGRRPG